MNERREYHQKRYAEKREEMLQYQKEYRARKKEENKNLTNAEKMEKKVTQSNYMKKWYQKNRETVLAKSKIKNSNLIKDKE